MPITTEVVSLNPAHGEVYSIQRYVIMWFADGQWFLSWYSGFLHQLNCNIVESGIKHHNPNPWSDKCSRITSHLALHNNKSINQINHNLLEMISQCMQLIYIYIYDFLLLVKLGLYNIYVTHFYKHRSIKLTIWPDMVCQILKVQ